MDQVTHSFRTLIAEAQVNPGECIQLTHSLLISLFICIEVYFFMDMVYEFQLLSFDLGKMRMPGRHCQSKSFQATDECNKPCFCKIIKCRRNV